jgi:DNA-binding response OmpR family regulator
MMSLGENRIKVGATKGNETINDATTKLTKLFHAKLLIIDEEPINVALLKTLFYNQNFDVTIATDADSAMNQLKNVAFDAIICERNLPKKDGFVIKNTLNEMPLNAKTLFILLTYQKTKDLVVRANQFDIDYVIQKPIIFEELLGFVQRHLRNRRQSS